MGHILTGSILQPYLLSRYSIFSKDLRIDLCQTFITNLVADVADPKRAKIKVHDWFHPQQILLGPVEDQGLEEIGARCWTRCLKIRY